MEPIDELMDELHVLLKKHHIKDIVLTNFDDDEMGFYQLVKIISSERGNLLVLSFSGKGDILCPCCSKNKGDCNAKD